MIDINRDNYRKEGFSRGWYCGVPIYIKDRPDLNTVEAMGINWFWDKVFNIVSWICINIRMDEGFEFKVLLECDNDSECPKNCKCIGGKCKHEDYI